MSNGNDASSGNGMVILPFSGEGVEAAYPVLRFEPPEQGLEPEPETAAEEETGEQLQLSDEEREFISDLESEPLPGPAAKIPAFEERLVRSGLVTLEQELYSFVRRYLNFPFRVNTAFEVRGYSAADALLDRISLIEESLVHGIVPSDRGVVAAAKIRIAFGKPEEAAALLRHIPDPKPEVRYFLALALHRAGEDRDALEACTGGAPGYQPRAAALYLEAVLLVKNGRAAEGLKRLREAFPYFRGNPAFLEYYHELSDLLGASGDTADALRGLLDLQPERTDRMEKLAAILYEGGNYEEAAELYMRLSGDGTGDEDVFRFRYAVCLAYTGGEQRAAEMLSGFTGKQGEPSLRDILFELMEQGMDDPVLRPLIARTWLVEGEAAACLDFIDGLAPGAEEKRLLLLRAEAQILLKNFKEALETLERIEFEDPFREAEHAFFRGLSLYSLKRYADAVPCFSRAEAGGFRKEACAFYLGETAFREGRYREAVSLLRRSRTGGFKKRQSTISLAYAALKAGMRLIAAEAFQEVLRIDPDFADAYNSLGILFAGQGRTEDAAAVLKQGLDRFPDDPELHHNLSLVYEGVLKRRSRDHFLRYRELQALAGNDGGEA